MNIWFVILLLAIILTAIPLLIRTIYKDNYRLEDVSGRSYILIHQGNKPSHTEGCLMPGEYYSEDWVGRSGDAYKALNTFLKEYGEDGIRIIIKNQ